MSPSSLKYNPPKTWIFNIDNLNMSSPVDLTIVKSSNSESEMLATSSRYIALQHAFDDHIPFLGRITRKDFKFYENGVSQSLNMNEEKWSSSCFDTPLNMKRLDKYNVQGFSLNKDTILDVRFNEDDDFIQKLHYISDSRRVSMLRIYEFSHPPNPNQNFWFMKSTRIKKLTQCRPSYISIGEKPAKRSMIFMKIEHNLNTDLIFAYNHQNTTVQYSGIIFFPLIDDFIHITSCEESTKIDIISADIYFWKHVLALPQKVYDI